jgi:hypothetical protein
VTGAQYIDSDAATFEIIDPTAGERPDRRLARIARLETSPCMAVTLPSIAATALSSSDWRRPALSGAKANAGTAAGHNCYFVFEFPVHESIYL